MGCGWSRIYLKKVKGGDENSNTGRMLREAFHAVASSHLLPGIYFIFPKGTVARVDSRNDSILSRMEGRARGTNSWFFP